LAAGTAARWTDLVAHMCRDEGGGRGWTAVCRWARKSARYPGEMTPEIITPWKRADLAGR